MASIADYLAGERRFMDWLTNPVQKSCRESAYEHITGDVTRSITIASLLDVWGVARDRGDRDGDDLILKHCDLKNLDDISGTPCFGEAMEYVGWVERFSVKNAKGLDIHCVRFPNFFKEEEPPEDRYRRQHREAQSRYRAKVKAKSVTCDVTGDVTCDVTVTPREEKRREEKNSIYLSSQATEKETADAKGYPEEFETFWQAYPPRNGKRVGKKKTFTLWKAIPSTERGQVVKAAKNYASSKEPLEGYARDPERFLKADWWRDWIEDRPPPKPAGGMLMPTDEELANWNPINGGLGYG